MLKHVDSSSSFSFKSIEIKASVRFWFQFVQRVLIPEPVLFSTALTPVFCATDDHSLNPAPSENQVAYLT